MNILLLANMSVINFKDKLNKFSDHWSPKVIAEMNEYQFKLVKINGNFVWHNHEHTMRYLSYLKEIWRYSSKIER